MVDPILLLILGRSMPAGLDWSDVVETLGDLQTDDIVNNLSRVWLLRAIRTLATLQERPWPAEDRRKNRLTLRLTRRKLAMLLLNMLEE